MYNLFINILRYPSFVDALRELDDALPMIFLFAHLPQHGQISVSCYEVIMVLFIFVCDGRKIRIWLTT